MDSFFSTEGSLFTAITKLGQLAILSVLWILCSLPVVTIGASSAALYYAVTKSVRHGRGYPVREFFRSFKKNLLKGSLFSVIFTAILVILFFNRQYLSVESGMHFEGSDITVYILCDALIVIAVFMLIYLFPVISRFEMRADKQAGLAFVMAIRNLHYTLLLGAGFALLVWLQYRLLPMATILFLPGAWTYLSSFLLEKAMRRYYPEPEEGVDAWWLE